MNDELLAVGTRVEVRAWDGATYVATIEAAEENIKNDRPGYELQSTWCYADQIVRVVR